MIKLKIITNRDKFAQQIESLEGDGTKIVRHIITNERHEIEFETNNTRHSRWVEKEARQYGARDASSGQPEQTKVIDLQPLLKNTVYTMSLEQLFRASKTRRQRL